MGGRGGSSGSDSSFTSGLSSHEKELATGVAKKRKDFFFTQIAHDESYFNYFKSKSDRLKAIKEDVVYSNLMVNENLPKLVGTPKQIAYAESIRRRELTNQASKLARELSRSNLTKEQKSELLKQAKKRGIKARSINDIFRNALHRTAAFYFNETSAKKIIEK